MLVTAALFVVLIITIITVYTPARQVIAKHKLRVVFIILFVIFFFTLFVMNSDFFTIDACLDNGGRWDKELGVCQLE